MKGLFLALLLFASQSWAAATPSIDSAWIASASSSAQAITTAFTTGSGANRVLIVNPGSTTTLGHGGYNQVSSVTFNGVACTFVSLTYAVSGTLYIGQEVWRLINPPASTTANVVVTYSIAVGDQNGYTVGQYKDVDQTTPLPTVGKSTALASPLTTSISPIGAAFNAFACATNWYAGGSSGSVITVAAQTVKRAESDFGIVGNSQMVANASTVPPFVTNTFSNPGTFSAGAQIIYEIQAVQLSARGQRSPFYWNRQSPKRGPMTSGVLR